MLAHWSKQVSAGSSFTPDVCALIRAIEVQREDVVRLRLVIPGDLIEGERVSTTSFAINPAAVIAPFDDIRVDLLDASDTPLNGDALLVGYSTTSDA